MELRPEQLLQRTQEGKIWPIYLITGAEMLHVIEAVDAICAQARKTGITERRVFDSDSRDFDWDQFVQALQAPSLFSQRRLIELRLPTAQPGKQGAARLIELCQAPPPDVICLIVGHHWSKAHHGKWVDAIAKAGVVTIAWPVKAHELPAWIDSRLRSKGIRADAMARQCLCERVEGNLLAARQEIDKLALLAEGEFIDGAKMDALISDMARFDVFRLIEQVLNGQAVATVRIIIALRQEGVNVAALMPMLIKELTRVAALVKEQANGRSVDAALKSLGIWPARQPPFRRALKRHSQLQRWEQWLVQMAEIDRMIKGRAIGQPWRALERILTSIASTHPPAVWL